jgi:Tfp pilus assembly protein PilN
MRALELDFRRESITARWAGAAVLALSLLIILGVAFQYRHLSDELSLAESEARNYDSATRKKASPPTAIEAQRSGLEVKRANEILSRLKLPWNELFASVEGAAQPNVALLSIESDTEKGRLKISAEARDVPAMLEYLRYLGKQSALADVYLQSHQTQQQDPQRPVRFVLGADWTARR